MTPAGLVRIIFLRWLVCLFLGHRWGKVREICHRSLVISHLHPLAGCDATCTRCGYHWRDTCGGSTNWRCAP